MSVPKVVIVGRPNVGKSSLLNWLAGKRVAIVEPTAGVTRDRVTYLMHEKDRYFELVDTGGIGINDIDSLDDEIEEQIRVGIDEADLILFVVDGQTGLAPLDLEVAKRLRHVEKQQLLIVNKCDNDRTEAEVHEFHRLTDAPLIKTSVKGHRNRGGLLSGILKHLPAHVVDEEESGESLSAEPEMKIAVVGRRNVGKSTLINSLAQSERVITSEVPGTTRDSIDIRFEADGKAFVAIDTPGVRRRKSLENDIEYYGLVRAKRSIRRADVVLFFFDSQETISKVDKQLFREVLNNYKPCIFVVNKWDLADEMTTEAWTKYLFETFSSMRHVPLAFLTAKESKNVRQLINLAQSIFKQSRIRVSTAELNKLLRAAVKNHPPPPRKNRRPKVYYATQVAVEPPTIVVKCNDPKLLDESWKRYLLGVLREELPFQEVPIRLILRSRGSDEADITDLDELSQAGHLGE